MKPDDDTIAFQVFNEIGIIEQLARNRFERTLPAGLTLPQFNVLNHFVRLGGEHSPARLASAFQVTRPTMTNTLQRLEAAGLVTSSPDPADGRAKIITVTDAGRAMRERCIEAQAPLLAELRDRLPEADLAALLPGLRRVRIMLDSARDT
jgi:DNA-binding MarR family transcriptional regulator